MNMNADQSERERLVAMIDGFWAMQAIGTATALGIPDLLAREPHDDTSLAKAVRCNAAALQRLMRALASLGLLVVALIAVVGLAKILSTVVEQGVNRMGAPAAVVGIIIAMLVLLPEGAAALRNARANRLQTSLNLALGSALASIGLTIPTVAVVSILMGQPVLSGLQPKEIMLLALTLIVGVITLGTGRTTLLQGVVHLAIFAAFLFFAVVP